MNARKEEEGMRRSKRGIALGAALCVLTLVVSVLLQKAGYLIYLNSDMASEIILANRQAQTHSLVQMDWLYLFGKRMDESMVNSTRPLRQQAGSAAQSQTYRTFRQEWN